MWLMSITIKKEVYTMQKDNETKSTTRRTSPISRKAEAKAKNIGTAGPKKIIKKKES